MSRGNSAKSPLFIRLKSWEYWPAWLTNIPVAFFWLYFAIRARSLFFFNAANPAIETGGVMGESKIDILNQVPEAFKPLTLFIPKGHSFDQMLGEIQEKGISFPLIAKPNVGERGLGVEKLDNEKELRSYRKKVPVDLIIQEFVDYAEEYSVLHYRFPNEEKGEITSLCHKIHLNVVGDGQLSLRELVKQQDRALLQLPVLEDRMGKELDEVPTAGEKKVLLPIGNHARGAMFLDANGDVDEDLRKVFDEMSHRLKDIYICRYDLKAKSLSAMKEGHSFKIVEINGVLGEPAHIYDPNYKVLRAYKDLFAHWKKVYEISKEVHQKNGVAYMSFGEMWRTLIKHLRYVKSFKKSLAHES